MVFKDRTDAGKQLAVALSHYQGEEGLLVLALPRGGVPVAYEVAIALHAPLDLWLVRKLGVPGQEELAMGAIAMGDVTVTNEPIKQQLDISEKQFQAVKEKECHELLRRNKVYRQGRAAPEVTGKTVILVDDGLATGATMQAAVMALRAANPKRIVVAVPTGTHEACHTLQQLADEVVCLTIPPYFYGVGGSYLSFPQNTDTEVTNLLSSYNPL